MCTHKTCLCTSFCVYTTWQNLALWARSMAFTPPPPPHTHTPHYCHCTYHCTQLDAGAAGAVPQQHTDLGPHTQWTSRASIPAGMSCSAVCSCTPQINNAVLSSRPYSLHLCICIFPFGICVHMCVINVCLYRPRVYAPSFRTHKLAVARNHASHGST